MLDKTEKCTIKLSDVAEHAGVSKGTASAVLNKAHAHVRVSEETRARIMRAVDVLGYRPNAIARSLRSQRTNIIGFYTGYGEIYTLDPFLSEVIFGMQKGCEAVCKDFLMHGNFRGRSVDDIFTELVNGKVDGLVAFCPMDDPLVKLLGDSRLPVVVIADAIAALPSVVVDDAGGSRLLAEYLAARGHRRVLYRTSEIEKTSVLRRLEGFREAAAINNITITAVTTTDWQGVLSVYEKKCIALGSAERPTAIVCWNDGVAYTTLEDCFALGLRVPEDIAIVGFDGAKSWVKPARQLTTVHAPWADVARTAVALLAAKLEGRPIEQETVLTVDLLVGDTA